MSDYAKVFGNAWAHDDAKVFGNAKVFDDAKIFGNAQVYRYAQVYKNAKIYENAKVSGNAWVTFEVCGDKHLFGFMPDPDPNVIAERQRRSFEAYQRRQKRNQDWVRHEAYRRSVLTAAGLHHLNY